MNYKDLERVNCEIRTTPIKGKDYAEVNQRVNAFRKLYPEGFITTELVSNDNGVCIFKASVGYNAIGNDGNVVGIILATGTAYEKESSSFINKTSYIENCETSAVGRALGNAGFGIDVSIASADEMQNAVNNQKKDEKPAPKTERQKLQKELQDYADAHNMTASEIIKDYNLSSKSSAEELKACLDDLKGEK